MVHFPLASIHRVTSLNVFHVHHNMSDRTTHIHLWTIKWPNLIIVLLLVSLIQLCPVACVYVSISHWHCLVLIREFNTPTHTHHTVIHVTCAILTAPNYVVLCVLINLSIMRISCCPEYIVVDVVDRKFWQLN